LLRRLIHAHERRHVGRENNRHVRPFEWGTSFLDGEAHANGDDPRLILDRHAERVMRESEDFYSLPAPVEDYRLMGDTLEWTSAVNTLSPENNTVRARFFPAAETANGNNGSTPRGKRAVIVLPQWNAQPDSHVALCGLLNRFGIAALRLTLPYHEARRPPHLERADYLVSSNIGRTIQSIRQAVLDARAAVYWLREHQGYERVGVVGTSIGSCVGFLALVHDRNIKTGVFNHVSGYVADVVWHGLSTHHVRAGFGESVTLEELRRWWLPISPLAFIEKLKHDEQKRRLRFIAARYDLVFPADLSRDVIRAVRRAGAPVDVAWVRCGHYSSGENPFKYIYGWKIISFLRQHL
jgi:dienelactone hydrolase